MRGEPPLDDPHLPWWAIAIGWAVAEACVVHLHFKRSAHSFSLADVPFVFGLAFASGDGVPGRRAARRRRSPTRSAGCRRSSSSSTSRNSRWRSASRSSSCARSPVDAEATEPRDLDRRCTSATLVDRRTDDRLHRRGDRDRRGQHDAARTLRQMFAMDGVVTAANSSIAIAAAVLIATDARAVVVLIVPAAIVFGVYRAYVSERQRHEKLEFLYEANRALTRSPEVAEAIEGVLARSLEAFRSEVAEVVLFSADGTPLRTTYGPGDERVTMVEGDAEAAEELAALIDAEHPVVSLTPPYAPERLRAHLERARHPARHGRDAARREPDDRHDHAREPVRDRARLRRRGSAAARGAGQQRQRRAPVRPPRAGRRSSCARCRSSCTIRPTTTRSPGCPTARCSWTASRASWPTATADARACCSSTSTTSRSSTTRSGTPSATRCWSPWPAACATPCGRRTSSRGSAATSSRSCCRTSRTRSPSCAASPRACCAPSRRRSTRATSSWPSTSASASPTAAARATPTS